MNLQLFRTHLANELNDLPDMKNQEIQSYVLTTAILTRRIIERLDINSLTIPQMYDNQQSHMYLRKILNIFIHYEKFSPEVPFNQDDFVVHIYSDKSKKDKGGQYLSIDLADYFSIVSKIAKDDLFVFRYLIGKVNKCLSYALHAEKELDPDCLNEIWSLVDDSICFCISLKDAGKLSFSNVMMDDVYELSQFKQNGTEYTGEYTKSRYFSSFDQFISGYKVSWFYTPFTPSRMNPGGLYSIKIETRNTKFIEVTFKSFLNVFGKIMSKLDSKKTKT